MAQQHAGGIPCSGCQLGERNLARRMISDANKRVGNDRIGAHVLAPVIIDLRPLSGALPSQSRFGVVTLDGNSGWQDRGVYSGAMHVSAPLGDVALLYDRQGAGVVYRTSGTMIHFANGPGYPCSQRPIRPDGSFGRGVQADEAAASAAGVVLIAGMAHVQQFVQL
jgi:hypothetical protein